MTIKQELDELSEEFEVCESQMEKLTLIIEYGKELEEYPQDKLKEEYKIPGCVSNVYFYQYCENNKMFYYAQSDALVVAGYLSLLISVLSGKTPNDIVESREDIMQFTKELNITKNLSPSRANAFITLLEIIFSYAQKNLPQDFSQ